LPYLCVNLQQFPVGGVGSDEAPKLLPYPHSVFKGRVIYGISPYAQHT